MREIFYISEMVGGIERNIILEDYGHPTDLLIISNEIFWTSQGLFGGIITFEICIN